MTIREGTEFDIPEMHLIRISVLENVLSTPGLVTEQDYTEQLTIRGKGWVCEVQGNMVGFSIADLENHNIWALFVHPEFEGLGIGRKLHQTMMDWYFSHSPHPVWLSTAPGTRAEAFYRKAGWKETGMHGKVEIRFEMTFEEWQYLKLR